MNRSELLELVDDLRLSLGQYAIFGGGSLAIRGIRDAKDLDIFVTEKLFIELLSSGWQRLSYPGGNSYLLHHHKGIAIQAFHRWVDHGWAPKIDEYINNPEIIDGLPFMSISELHEWKSVVDRPKDRKDVILIERYWETNNLTENS
jgi:hypothetical protein